MKRRTASYKRKRRTKTKNDLEKLIAKTQRSQSTVTTIQVVFYQRRHMLFSLKGTGVRMMLTKQVIQSFPSKRRKHDV